MTAKYGDVDYEPMYHPITGELLLDPESCSWCVLVWEDDELVEADDGARCCPSCVEQNRERFPSEVGECYACPGSTQDDPVMRRFTGRTRTVEVRRDPTATYELTCGHWTI